MNIAVLCDFDDTVAQGNVAHLLLDRFGDGSWRELRRRYLEGTLPPEEYFERPFSAMKASQQEMAAHVRARGRLADGFVQLAEYCRCQGVELGIVTLSLDFSVRALLEQQGLGWLPVYAVGTRFTEKGIQFDFPYAAKECRSWGICKCSVVERYHQKGQQVVYIGDGRNDLCPAKRADIVFARGELLELCRQEGLACRELRDFQDVIEELGRLTS
ncbi:MAG: MtnX-like HAD-IB family phosphatase [Chloroflexota bacterium]